jgi:hypothetical protein
MTIVAAVKSRDGLVLGTDSMSQVVGMREDQKTAAFLKAYGNATKLFRLGESDIGIASWGVGNLGTRSIGGLILDYSETLLSLPATIEEAARGLTQFVGPVYDGAFSAIETRQRPPLGFLLGGYSQQQPLPELWEVRLPPIQPEADQVSRIHGPEDFGANWRGIELPFTRLHIGFDPRTLNDFIEQGVDRAIVEQIAQKYQSPVVFDSMPIQDAINFCGYILRTTIAFSTFEVGIPACGEPLQMAVILRRQGFIWVEEPRFHV